jgi:hypothetical protein
VRRALDELASERVGGVRAGRLLGPSHLVLERCVPGTVDEVGAAVHRFLRSQLFEPQRLAADRTRWVRREGLGATLRRAADVNRRLRLEDVRAVDCVVLGLPGPTPGALVRLELDLGAVRRRQRTFVVGGAGMGLAGAGAVVLVAGLGPAAALALPVGAGIAAAGGAAGRRSYRARAARAHDAVAGRLDALEHPGSAQVASGRDPVRSAVLRAGSQGGPSTSHRHSSSPGTAGDQR